jgi:hypothetical protein
MPRNNEGAQRAGIDSAATGRYRACGGHLQKPASPDSFHDAPATLNILTGLLIHSSFVRSSRENQPHFRLSFFRSRRKFSLFVVSTPRALDSIEVLCQLASRGARQHGSRATRCMPNAAHPGDRHEVSYPEIILKRFAARSRRLWLAIDPHSNF